MSALIWFAIALGLVLLVGAGFWYWKTRPQEVFHFSEARKRYSEAKTVKGTRWHKRETEEVPEKKGFGGFAADELGTYTFVGPGIAVRYVIEGMTETIRIAVEGLDTLVLHFVEGQLNGMNIGSRSVPAEHPELRCNKNAAKNFRNMVRRHIGLYTDPEQELLPDAQPKKSRIFYGRPGEEAPEKPEKKEKKSNKKRSKE